MRLSKQNNVIDNTVNDKIALDIEPRSVKRKLFKLVNHCFVPQITLFTARYFILKDKVKLVAGSTSLDISLFVIAHSWLWYQRNYGYIDASSNWIFSLLCQTFLFKSMFLCHPAKTNTHAQWFTICSTCWSSVLRRTPGLFPKGPAEHHSALSVPHQTPHWCQLPHETQRDRKACEGIPKSVRL